MKVVFLIISLFLFFANTSNTFQRNGTTSTPATTRLKNDNKNVNASSQPDSTTSSQPDSTKIPSTSKPPLNNKSIHGNKSDDTHDGGGIHLFKIDFIPLETPFIVCVWVLIASLAKIVFHHYQSLSSTIPESCLLILLGIPIGFILKATGQEMNTGEGVHLTSSLFFFFLLPPIILDAGYFMTSDIFYQNIGTILLYAILGTIFNTFLVGASIFGISQVCYVDITLLKSLVFGSLISAVDPVAVLAVFEEVQVNEVLYMLVFGESVLNDAASVVLYKTFVSLSPNNITIEQIGLAFASFFVVSFGGTLIGVIYAIVASFITRFTDHVLVIEPVFVFLMSYLAYLTAEIFHFSGIMSILFCGIVMKPYVESNVSRKSHTTIKYFLKLLSSSCESIIFMFLGVSLVTFEHELNFSFIMFTLLFITVFRAIGITLLTGFANRFGRLSKVKKVEQFIMSYGGLRGAVAFCLAILLKPDNCHGDNKSTPECTLKRILVTTTISVVLFTCFVQGCTIKKLVDVLGVKKSTKRDKSMGETLNDRVLSYMVAGMEEILGVHSHGFWMNLIELFNRKYMRRWLERDPDLALDEELVCTQRRIAFKTALSYADKPQEIADREQDGIRLEEIKNNASAAMQLAIVAQQTPGYDGGFLDVGVLSASPQVGTEMIEHSYSHNSEAFNPRMITSLIPKAKSGMKHRRHVPSTRKYTLDSLEESDYHSHNRHLKKARAVQMEHYKSSRRSPHSHHHRRQKNGPVKEDKKHTRVNIDESEPKEDDQLLHPIQFEEGGEQVKQDHDVHSGDANDVRADGENSHRKHTSHHSHSHHKHKHKHKHNHNRRKESEVLPQLSDMEAPIRDTKCHYDFNDLKSEEYQDNDLIDGSKRDICIDIPEESCTMNGTHSNDTIELVGSSPPGEKEYVPELPLYNNSPSRQFSPYADTPLLDRSKTQMSGRDKQVLLEAKRKHSTVKSTMLNNLNNSSLGTLNNHPESLEDTLPIEEVAIMSNPWATPPQIRVDFHMGDSISSGMNV